MSSGRTIIECVALDDGRLQYRIWTELDGRATGNVGIFNLTVEAFQHLMTVLTDEAARWIPEQHEVANADA